MKMSRAWAMPSRHTFEIKPIRELLRAYHEPDSVDPFAGRSRIATFRNDLDTDKGQEYSMDALEFLRRFENEDIATVLFDPPYSPRQVSECYKKTGQDSEHEDYSIFLLVQAQEGDSPHS